MIFSKVSDTFVTLCTYISKRINASSFSESESEDATDAQSRRTLEELTL